MFERILFPNDFAVFANAVTACLPSLRTVGVKEVTLVYTSSEPVVWRKMCLFHR